MPAVKEPTLSVKQLAAVFAVTEMTIYNWRKESVHKTALPKKCTSDAVKRWARNNDVSIRVQPKNVLAKVVRGKPGPKPTARSAIKRNGAGRLMSARATRGG